MPETNYLTPLDIESLHIFVMERTGDEPSPMRDRALLESAVMRPQMAAYYAGADLIEQCALLAVSISQAGAFVDGNKRTAFISADVFLRANGHLFSGDPLEMARRLETVANHKANDEDVIADFAKWLRDNVAQPESG